MSDLKTFLTTAQGRVKEVSGVKNVSTKTNTAGTGWYTLDGRRLTAPTQGLMIVRQADGTTKSSDRTTANNLLEKRPIREDFIINNLSHRRPFHCPLASP